MLYTLKLFKTNDNKNQQFFLFLNFDFEYKMTFASELSTWKVLEIPFKFRTFVTFFRECNFELFGLFRRTTNTVEGFDFLRITFYLPGFWFPFF